MPELRALTQLPFVSRWQMIYDTISSPMIAHCCLPLLCCPGWAVCLLSVPSPCLLYTLLLWKQSYLFLRGVFFIWSYLGIAQENRRRVGSHRHFPSADVWPGNCNNAAEEEEGEGFTRTGEWGKQTKGNSLRCYRREAHSTHQQNWKPPVQTLHLHPQFLALV